MKLYRDIAVANQYSPAEVQYLLEKILPELSRREGVEGLYTLFHPVFEEQTPDQMRMYVHLVSKHFHRSVLKREFNRSIRLSVWDVIYIAETSRDLMLAVTFLRLAQGKLWTVRFDDPRFQLRVFSSSDRLTVADIPADPTCKVFPAHA